MGARRTHLLKNQADVAAALSEIAPAPRFQRHVFVCTNAASCDKEGQGSALHAALKARLVAAGLKESVRINKAGCLGQCGHGPMVVTYPEAVWYSHVGVADAGRIWDQHVLGGRPVDELRYETELGGTNVYDAPLGRAPQPHSSPCGRCPGASRPA